MKRFKELRLQNNLKQSDISSMLNTSSANVSSWENGRWQPDIENLIKISRMFHCSIDYLVGIESEDGLIVMTNELSDSETHFVDMLRTMDEKNKNTFFKPLKRNGMALIGFFLKRLKTTLTCTSFRYLPQQ